jgi:hypothetical protein
MRCSVNLHMVFGSVICALDLRTPASVLHCNLATPPDSQLMQLELSECSDAHFSNWPVLPEGAVFQAV